MVESSDKTWSTGEGNVKALQHSCENPMNSMKRQKDTYVYIYIVFTKIFVYLAARVLVAACRIF